MAEYKIAVLMSSYNGEKYIGRQIETILGQKLSGDLTLFIRDDGSKDKTVSVIKEYVEKDNRIRLIKGKNRGSVASFFEVLKAAQGYDYYAFSDQDDEWDNDKLEIAVRRLQEEDGSIPLLYGSTTRVVDGDGKFIRVSQKEEKPITFYNAIIQNFMAGNTQVFNENLAKYFREKLDYQSIYVHDSFVLNTAIICGKAIFDNEPHMNYRQHENNQIGVKEGKLNWLSNHIARLKKGEQDQYARQIYYITKKYYKRMTEEERMEMRRFFGMQKHLSTRMKYASFCKLYRQKDDETVYFKLLYILGKYNIE